MNLPHPDTIDQVLLIISPEKIEILKTHLVSKLFDQKLLRKFRFLGKYYFVAVDATGTHTFDHQQCIRWKHDVSGIPVPIVCGNTDIVLSGIKIHIPGNDKILRLFFSF